MDRESRGGVVVVAVLALFAAAVSLAPDRVVACWRAVRSPGPELPFDNSLLPANVVQWLWHSGHDDAYKVLVTAPNGETSEVSVERTALDPLTSPRPVIVGIDQFRVIEPLESGSELSFVRCAHVDADGEEVGDETLLTYKIGKEAELPASLGVIAATQEVGTLRIRDAGRCYVDLKGASFARVSLDLAEDARPFEAMLRYELRVDDERSWTYDDGEQNEQRMGTSSLGAGEDIVYVGCHGEIPSELKGAAAGGPPELEKRLTDWLQFLEPGEHRVQMIGLLPDGRKLASNTLRLDLQCSGQGAQPHEVETETALNMSRSTTSSSCSVTTVGTRSRAGLLTLMLSCFALCAARRR